MPAFIFARPASTILLVTDYEVARADFSSRGGLIALWRSERVVDAGLSTAVDAAIGLGGKVGRRVQVLTTSAWTQTISINAKSVTGLTSDERDEMLKFEVESFSNLNAFDAAVAHLEIDARGDAREFWVTEIERSQLVAVADVVTARGGRLAGVCHPAGLPVRLLGEGAWRRMEFWQDLVCCVEMGRGPRGLFITNADQRSDRWETALENWQRGRTMSEGEISNHTLVGPGVAVSGERIAGEPLLLSERTPLERWLSAWNETWAAGTLDVPLLKPAARPVSTRAHASRAAILTAVVLGACVAHGSHLSYSSRWYDAQIEGFKGPADQLKKLQQELTGIENALSKLQKRHAAIEDDARRIESMTGAGRGRVAELLEQLARRRSEDIVISKVTVDGEGIVIKGKSLATDAATRLAGALRPHLIDQGWSVALPKQQGADQMLNGGPWEFEIQLVETTPPEKRKPEMAGAAAAVDAE